MRFGGPCLVLAAFFCLAGCTGGGGREAAPAVWIVRDSDTVIYVTGTVHLLPDNINWQSPAMASVMARSSTLVTELSPEELAKAPKLAAKYFYRRQPEPLAGRVAPELRRELAALATEFRNIPDIERLDDWALGLILAQQVAAKAGLDGANGMDNGLIAAFADAGKPRIGLERATDQFARFDAIPVPEQRRMLHQLMREIEAETADDRLLAAVEAWAKGDTKALAMMVARDKARAPETNRLLLLERNRLWADRIVQQLARPGTILVAVGVGHLVGPDSLLAQLQARKVAVARLDSSSHLAKADDSR